MHHRYCRPSQYCLRRKITFSVVVLVDFVVVVAFIVRVGIVIVIIFIVLAKHHLH